MPGPINYTFKKQGFISAGRRYDFPQDIFENISYFEGILDQVEFYSRIELYRYNENIYLVPNLGNCSHRPLNEKFCMSDLFDNSIFSSQAFEILSSNHIFKYSCILLKIISVMEV